MLRIPLNADTEAIGVVLAAKRPSIITALLRLKQPRGQLLDTSQVTPDQVLTLENHGPLGLSIGRWRIHGSLPGFEASEWPELKFYQAETDEVIVYDCQKVVEVAREPGLGNRGGWPEDGASGDVYVEKVLARRLGVDWRED